MADRRRKKTDIEEAKRSGQKALEDAKAGKIQRVESENEVRGFAEIPYLQGGNSNFGDTSPSVAIDTPSLPTVQQIAEISKQLQEQNASRNAQRRAERDRMASLAQSQSESVPMGTTMAGYGPDVNSGTLDRRGSLSENGQKEVDKLNKRIESLQRTPMTGDAAVDEVTQSNNQSEIADLQRQIDSIYETDNSERSANVDRYLDSNRKLSKYEKNEANAIFEEYLNNNPKAKELYNTNDAAMSSLLAQRFTPDEAEEYAKMVTLKNKISRGQSAGLHATESMPFVKGLADKSTEKYGERIGRDLSDYDYSSQLEQTQTQNPLASMGGNMAYQLGSYAAFAPLLEGIPVVGKAAEKVGGLFKNPAVGEAAANIVRGQAADTILDTLPNEVLPDIMEGNWRDLPKDILLNQAGNLAFNLGGEAVGALANRVIPYLRNTDEVADAVKQNEIDPAELAKQNEVDVNAKVDNVNQAVDEIDYETARLLQRIEGAQREANYSDSFDARQGYEREVNRLTQELKQKAPGLFDENGRLKNIPDEQIRRAEGTIPQEIKDYVQKRDDLINRTQTIFGESMSPEEMAQTFRSINAMDEYMNQKYPDLFENGNFVGLNEAARRLAGQANEINNLAEQIPQSSMDPAHELAGRYAATYEAFNDYDAMDQVYEADSFIEGMADDIANGRNLSQYIDALEENIDDAPDEEIRASMQSLIDELKRVDETNGNRLTADEVEALQRGVEQSAAEETAMNEAIASAANNAAPANRELENRIRQSISDLEMSPETRSAVEDSMKTFDDLLERIDNAQSQEEIEALMEEAERIGRDADNLLKGGAQSRLIAKNQFDEDTRSFINAINGTTIKIPDNLRGEFPDQTLKQLQQRLHFYGEGKNYGANLRKGSGTPIESLFEDIDNATGHALSGFMESRGYNIDSPEGQLKALIEYADALKANQNTSKVMDYNGGIFDDWYQEMVDRSVKRNGELRQLANQMDGSIPTRPEVPSASRQTVDDVAETVTPETTNVPPVNNGGDEPVIELTQGGNGDLRERGLSRHIRDQEYSFIPQTRGNVQVKNNGYINIGFDKMPDKDTIAALKDRGFKWDAKNKVWYAKNNANRMELADSIKTGSPIRSKNMMRMEGVSDEVRADFIESPDMYKQLSNADTQALADDIYKSGDQTISINGKVYRGDIETKFRALLEDKNPASLPLGHQLAKDYSAAGNHDMAAQIYRDMGKELTKAGQFSQASVLAMMKNDPLTAMQYAQKELSAINTEGAKKFGKKWKDMTLTPEEIQAFNSITPGDTEAIKALYDKIGARLGKEYPTTFMEKLLEGRKVAMLFNLRTNVRNFGANVPTLGLRWVSDRLAAVGEGAIHLINPKFARTQAVTGSGIQGRKLASEIFSSPKVQALLDGTAGKYEVPELKNTLMKDRQMFKGTPVSKWINKVTNGGIEKVNKKLFGKEGVESGLETIRNATYKMLDLGDSPFVRENFIERLGSYIHANKIKNVDDVPEEAIQMAWEEAMKATYKDNSWAVQMLRGIKTQGIEKIPGIGKPLSQALIPFLQAPGNIAARMVDYSPINATKGIADIIAGATKKNEAAVRKGIDEAAKGLTGSGLIVLGMKLREAGLITGDYSEDKDQKNFEKQNGFIPWALHIGDKYFQYDWAQPFAEPLIVGTLLQDAIDKSDQYDSDILNYFGVDNQALDTAIGVTKEGTKAAINSWFNASPLQGLAEIMSGGYNGTDIAQNLFDAGVGDFAGALIPSLVNASAKTADTTQRQAYDPSNTFASFVNQQKAKIPGLSDNLSAKYDTFGNEMKYADSNAEAFAQRFLIPGNYGTDTNDPIDIAINDLFNETQDAKVFPTTAPNSVSGIKLTAQDVSDYQRDMGQRSRQIVEAFINSDLFKSLDNDEKVSALNEIYGTSKAITERNLFNKSADNSDYKKAIEAYDTDKEAGVLEHLSSKYNKYGIDAKAYREMVENGEDLTPYEGYKEARASLDIDDSAAYRNAYASGNTPEEKIANLQNEMEYQNTCKEVGIDPDGKTARAAWDKALHASGDPVAALQKVAENKENAINSGFVKSDGTVNQAAYDKAVNVLGDDPNALSNYASFQTSMSGLGTARETYLPKLEALPGLSNAQKGQFAYLYGGAPKSGSSADQVLNSDYGYEGYYDYLMIQNSPDLNNNGKAHDKGDRIKYMYDVLGWDDSDDIYKYFVGLNY